jgi:NAD+ synthetase
VKIALAQINPTVGDFCGNAQKILDFARRAQLLEKPAFVARAAQVVDEIAAKTASSSTAIILGYVTPAHHGSGKHVMNSAALLRHGHVEFVQSKMLLPFYDVFDEQRYFAPAEKQRLFSICGERVALTICEDAWNDKSFWENRLYTIDPVEELMRGGGSLILNISASPYWRNKRETRREMLAAIARRHHAPVLMVNQVGGNDSLVFDGSSIALDRDGEVIAQAKSFEEDLIFIDLVSHGEKASDCPATGAEINLYAQSPGERESESESEHGAIFQALVMGTRDYVRKCGFAKAIIGLSGGIDSALVAAIAVEALGKENVLGVGMPSPYSSPGSIDDSRHLAENLGIRFELIAISDLFAEYNKALGPMFAGLKPDIAEENIQSRVRGNLLMALSNKFNALVLTTGNKSEMSTGYCTLYGDMVGALAVIGDVVKTEVYALCRYVNREREIIPISILEKPPSAELRPDQKDTDSLPPYDVLDPILEAYVERYETPEAIAAARGLDLELVRKVVKLVERSEYKRQQAAPVLKVTAKAFGMGRRFPIAVKVQV